MVEVIDVDSEIWVVAKVKTSDFCGTQPTHALFLRSAYEGACAHAARLLESYEGDCSVNVPTKVSEVFLRKAAFTDEAVARAKDIANLGIEGAFKVYRIKGELYYGTDCVSGFDTFKWVFEDTRFSKHSARENYYSKHTDCWLVIEG